MHALKKLTELLSALMLVTLILTSCGCSIFPDFDTNEIRSVKTYEGSAISTRAYRGSDAVRLAGSEAAEIYFDKASGGISFTSLYTGKSWASLPTFENSFAASFIVKALAGDTVHCLDTSSCSAAKNGIRTEKTENGAIITYSLTSGDVTVELPVEFSISGAVIEVSCDMSACKVSDGVKIISVQLLPYLGAIRYTAASADYAAFGDWYLVPDGAGALMYTAIEDENTRLTLSVYGKDYYEEYISAGVGAYGVKQTGGAFSATVCEGDENALIRVFRSGADTQNINRIYPEFIITPVSGAEGKIKTGKAYEGTISVSYELLSSSDCSYTDVATSVRQSLIRAGLMSAEKCDSVYPLTISLVASTDGSRKNTTATLGQAENLLSVLKGKGVNEIDMVLLGAFSDGLENSASDGLGLVSSVGKEAELEELLSYAGSQKLRIFAGANLLTGNSSLSGGSLSGEKKSAELTNPLSPYVGEESYKMKYLGSSDVARGANRLLALLGKYDFYGVCITDAESSVYENADGSQGLYEGYESTLQGNLSSLTAASSLMLSGYNANIMKYAERLYDVSFDSVTENTGSYATVPFIPVIVHGSVVYSGQAVNLDSVSRINLLKSIEYGAVPHYLWVSDERSDKHYDFTINEAVEFMLEADEKLSDLPSKRITEHFMYEDGVYCTGYEGGVRVFVNYNNYSVIIGEVSVMPYNFLRIG